MPKAVIHEIAISLDCKPKFMGHLVRTEMMVLMLVVATIVLCILYLFLSQHASKR
ncbi:hypothetical protein [Sharpea azabuensis]|uniref:hypothetical protein n=1 Tax=Sharpea azabuensis TaxID=322505 RepID=UPI0015A5B5AD|nr:hypothetical protein [Sharpea azabuensis]